MTASTSDGRKPCRYCGKRPTDWRHALDDGTGDHGYAPEQFEGDRAEPLFQSDYLYLLPTSTVAQLLGHRPTVDEAAKVRGRLAGLLAEHLPALVRELKQ